MSKNKKYFTFFSARIRHALDLSEIVYFEKDGRSAYVHTLTEVYRCNKSNQEIIEQLSDEFIQIHCSFIVNLQYLVTVKQNIVLLKYRNQKNETIKKIIPVGGRFKNNIKNRMSEKR